MGRNVCMKKTGGELVLAALEKEKIPYILGIPGHGILGLFDAIRKSEEQGKIRYIQVKHEQAAAHIADGYYRIKGEPLAVFTSIGPGALNTVIGVATSYVDSTAMLLFCGDTHTHMKGVGVLQEIERYQDSNFIRIMEPAAKRSWRAERVEQLPRMMERAFNQMLSGRPGPVVVSLPMDVQADACETEGSEGLRRAQYSPAPDERTLKDAVELMKAAKRPVILLGGGALRARAAEKLVKLAELWGAAVVTTMAGKSAFPEGHPLYCFHTGSKGTPVGLHVCKNADLILALGTRFADETTCSYKKGVSFNFPDTKLIHVDIDAAELGKNYHCDVAMVADLTQAVDALSARYGADAKDFDYREAAYTKEIAEKKREWFAYLAEIRARDYGQTTISQLIGRLNEILPEDTIISTSSGNTQAQLFQEYCFRKPYRHLTTGGFSTMGWAVPAAIGAKLARPDCPVVALLGDGDFMMIMQELSTIAQYDIPILVIVANNSGWLAIQDLQCDVLGEEKAFGNLWTKGEESYTPDFIALAKAFHMEAMRVDTLADLDEAVARALSLNKPVLIEAPVTPAYPESGGKAFGWWDVPIPEYIEDRRSAYLEAKKDEQI